MATARIVIVNYNGREFVAEAIASALAQSADCEVALVDNASTDGSLTFVRANYPGVHAIESTTNLGFGGGANLGARAPLGPHEFVAFLNPDAIAQPDWIERIAGWMNERDVDVASSVVSGNTEPFFAGGKWRPFLGAAVREPAFIGERTDWISGCAMVVRRAAFERLNGFDPAYFLYYEDVDLSLRASKAGFRLGVYAEPLVAHPREGRSADQLGSLRKRCEGLRSKGTLVRRFVPPYAMPSALLFQTLVSPAANKARMHEYPALVRAFVAGVCGSGSVGGAP